MIGQQVGGYTLEHRIGEGAIGIVYQGRKPDGAVAAVKVVRPELAGDQRYAMTVIAEARAVSTIGHPGIVNIFDLGLLSDGRPFLVMELVDGHSLEDLLSYGPMDPNDALEILEDLFAALDAAHRKNVLHRDIKPANIYLAGDAQGRRVVKLLDFGLARLNFAPGSNASMVVGTPDYMAPEQASSKLTYASDLYAVGVVAFRMLTGQLPFIGQSTMEVIMAHVKHTPQKPSVLKPGLSPKLDTLVLGLLEKSPSQRPASADVARQSVAAMRKGTLEVAAHDPTIVGDETFRPFVPKKPFHIPTLQDDDDGDHAARRTEPFQAMVDHRPADVTEPPTQSPFGGKPADVTLRPQGKPADSTLPPSGAKPGNETIRDHTTAKSAVHADDDEATVSSGVSRPTEPDHRAMPAEPKRGRGMLIGVLAALVLLGGAAAWWLKLLPF
jgi:serine/threonine protein kinase